MSCVNISKILSKSDKTQIFMCVYKTSFVN